MTRVLTADALTAELGPDRTLPLAGLGSGGAGGSGASGASGVEVGIWEMAPGTEQDTEADEVFVVLAGRGTVTFADGDVVDLRPGVVVRLTAGEHTTWTVTETLRKVYVAV